MGLRALHPEGLALRMTLYCVIPEIFRTLGRRILTSLFYTNDSQP